MKTGDAIALLDQLLQQHEGFGPPRRTREGYVFIDPYADVIEWLATTERTFRRILPTWDPLVQRWAAMVDQTQNPNLIGNVDGALGLIRAAKRAVERGELSTAMDVVRAETVVEVLDQADELLAKGAALPAVVVLTCGALETHLRHLCEQADPARTDLVWNRPGSIDTYKGALDRARKAGTTKVSLGDTKQITAWGNRRNKAAHTPLEFDLSMEEVRLMNSQVREFVARTSTP